MATDDQQAISKTLSGQGILVQLLGLERSNTAMWRLASRLEDAGYEVHWIGYSSINMTTDEVIDDITQQITDRCVNESRPVNFVGHSLGGLLMLNLKETSNSTESTRVRIPACCAADRTRCIHGAAH
ncbi:MAG: alpha/beta hydrolase [Candidatus Thiodiazotropha sp. (ex Ctena orbiculata)]|uniref:Alpha/beta hydrolase n=1 Tax=Candidatus Thiodiazotropha taylori TaxID=2792791 RepID=A0A944MDA6_9GAMM|nr:alpha/beta hydrolase [Candidatus Thiodiazotropha taylori]MBT2989322.1 alpha/beta hydrolase [Candidatus Thiodiazotropha taylori]MBT2996902.1 alpha/beta hydrolase [Candidatus Thiodiazotropha taylori]MBT3000757.1 alpha/beta hydrolase [Candidatus Thiodiazotropha taylori]MBT3029426.1 alpha/beta hydrolase [Candidatus Thiodiazotropha taylori]